MLSSLLLPLLLSQSAPAGSPADWEMRPKIEKLGRALTPLKTMLGQIQPGSWNVEGGAEAYVRQQKSCMAELANVENVLARWSARPDRLSLMLEALVRIGSLTQQSNSLAQGMRRYSNPAMADLLDSLLNSLSGDLEWLRSQALELAQQRELELDVAQKEAQRCRTQILQPRPPRD